MSLSTSKPTTAGIVTAQNGDRLIPESTRADGSTRKAIRIRPGFRPAEDIERYRCRGAQNRAQARAAGPPGSQPAVEEEKKSAPSPRTEAPAVAAPAPAPVASAPAPRYSARDEPPTNSQTATYVPPTGNTRQPARNTASSSASTAKSPAYLMSSWRRGPAEPAPSKTTPQRTETSNAQAKNLIAKALAPNTSSASPAAPAVEEQAADPVDAEAEREKKARGLKKKLKQARDLQAKKGEGKMLLPEQMAKVIKINELVRELEMLGFGPDEDHKQEPEVAAVTENEDTTKTDASSSKAC